ncbi:MAG: MarR family transcriptional regulator [Nitrospirae bacterium]|nr:MAG: MarR family transcriptional regulator [Nitrospirota bacterium]
MKKFREGGFLIAKIHTLSERVLAKILKKYCLTDINPAQGRIFFALWQGDGISIRELAQKTSLEKSTLTSMLDRLEKNGFVARVPSKEDRRKILIKLTEKDRKLENVYTRICEEKMQLFYKGFTKKEIDKVESFLMRILGNLESFEKKTGR